MELRKTFRFEASHILPKHPGKCSRLHGHSWVLHVFVKGPRDPNTGFVLDFADISAHVKPLIERLDHRHLGQWIDERARTIMTNDSIANGGGDWSVEGLPQDFYPSSENLLWWIGSQLTQDLDWHKLALEETCTSYAELTRDEYVALHDITDLPGKDDIPF